jgi:hypothetical protein
LERQLADYEREQAELQSTLEEKEESEKSALRRWQEAQRTLAVLEEQMERIEQEAKEERERQAEVLARVERRHNVERELDIAAGRLKGAALVKTTGTGPNVVSHFVKDILQDNANLQMGIVELRDMLQTSNEEVETLRKRLSVHQPVVDETDIAQPTSLPDRPHLKEEMRRATAQELHVHHHYHSPSTPKTPAVRRPKKKRYGALSSGHFSSGSSTPRHQYYSPSNTAVILSQTAASLPEREAIESNRWSVQSAQTYHSMQSFSGASSPSQSTNRASSMFDRVFSDAGQDSSRPTTPDTDDPGSPLFAPINSKRPAGTPLHSKRASVSSHRNRPSLDSILDTSTENLRDLDIQQAPEAPIPEEDEHEWEQSESVNEEQDTGNGAHFDDHITQALKRPPALRRATSHESILSCRGMDIHTLSGRPSQLLTPFGGRSFTPQAVISDTTAHATGPAAMSQPSSSSHRMLSGMAPSAHQRHGNGGKSKLGSKVGGWMFGKWGQSPTSGASTGSKTPDSSRALSIASGSTGTSTEDRDVTPKQPKLRPPGINQSGPIFGFGPEQKIQHPPIMKSFDPNALKNVLDD